MGDGKSFSCYNSHGGHEEFDLLANGNNHEGWEEFDLLTGLTMDGGGGGGDRKTLTVHGNNLWGWDKYCFEALIQNHPCVYEVEMPVYEKVGPNHNIYLVTELLL